MEIPRLHSYPFDQETVTRIRAREHAREAERLVRRHEAGNDRGWRAVLEWIAG